MKDVMLELYLKSMTHSWGLLSFVFGVVLFRNPMFLYDLHLENNYFRFKCLLKICVLRESIPIQLVLLHTGG